MVLFMRAVGEETYAKDLVFRRGMMVHDIKETGIIIRLMAEESLHI